MCELCALWPVYKRGRTCLSARSQRNLAWGCACHCGLVRPSQSSSYWQARVYLRATHLSTTIYLLCLYLLTNHVLSASGNAGGKVLELLYISLPSTNHLVAHILCWSSYLLLSIYYSCIGRSLRQVCSSKTLNLFTLL